MTTEPWWAERARATGRVVWTAEDGWVDWRLRLTDDDEEDNDD